MEKKMRSAISLARATVALAICSIGWPLARATPADEGPPVVTNAAEAPTTPPAPAPVTGLGVPMGGNELDGYRGGFDVVKNDMQLSGTVANNSATNVPTGNNTISDGAFANMNGIPMVVQNSGSNVLIQNATIVNVQLK